LGDIYSTLLLKAASALNSDQAAQGLLGFEISKDRNSTASLGFLFNPSSSPGHTRPGRSCTLLRDYHTGN